MIYFIIFVLLFALELCYFKIADHFNIIDRPNERSSHKQIVLRGGGIIFIIALWLWSIWYGFQYPWLLAGVTLAAGVSFWDDVKSLPDSVRLVAQFVAMVLMFWSMGIMNWSMWWIVPIALIVCVGAANIINFMDGINGITAGYALAMLIPLLLLDVRGQMEDVAGFIEPSYLVVAIIGVLVFSIFNFRPKGKAKCFAGDVGSIGIAFIILFAAGRLIIAHRKHAYQLMANELKIGHVKISLLYMVLQLAVSTGFIYLIPNTALAHWIYLICMCVVFSLVYILFKMKYYHLHEEYLASLRM